MNLVNFTMNGVIIIKKKDSTKINKLFEQSERERLKELMLAQLLGFRLASSGFGIKELVSSAGLTFDEWNEIKDETDVTSLKDSELDEIEEYVNELEKGGINK